MNEVTEGFFISHCDGGENFACDLGKFEYTCPACGKESDDFGDVWWERDSIYGGQTTSFNCEKCEAPLQVRYDREEMEVLVSHDADRRWCKRCDSKKVAGTACHGEDVCIYGDNGGADECCDGWGVRCCRCGEIFAKLQM